MMRSRKSNLPARIARAIIFVAAFSFSVCFSFKQNRAEEKCATFFAESRVLSSSLFLKKNWFFSSLVPKFLSLASSSSPSSSCRPFLSRKDQKEKKISPEEARAFRSHEAVSSHHHARQKALASLQTLLAFGGSVLPFVIVCARVLVVICEREREREKRVERRGGVERGKFHFLQKICSFPSPKLQSPPLQRKKEEKEKRFKISFHLKSAKKRDTMVLCLPSTSGRAKISCRDTVSSSSNSLRNRSRRATKPLVLKQPSASLQSKTTRGNTQTFMKTSTSASSHFFFMSGKVNKRDAIKTAFSASASGFFSAANNEVNNVKKLDQSVSLYEKLEREIRTSDGKSLSLSDCVIKLALNEPSVTLRDRVMVSLCAEAMSIIPECGLENASLVISMALKHALVENGIDESTIEVKVGYVKSTEKNGGGVRCDAHVWLEVDHRIIDLSVDGVQIVEMARKACISYEDVEKMAEHFSLEIAKEVNKDIRPATVLGIPIVLNECRKNGLMLKEPPLTVEGAANAIETAKKYRQAIQTMSVSDIEKNLENKADLKNAFLRLSGIKIERVSSAKNKFHAFEDAAENMDKALRTLDRLSGTGPR